MLWKELGCALYLQPVKNGQADKESLDQQLRAAQQRWQDAEAATAAAGQPGGSASEAELADLRAQLREARSELPYNLFCGFRGFSLFIYRGQGPI